MNHFVRFLLGLGALFVGALVALIFSILISPLVLVGSILSGIILAIVGVIAAIGSFFTFIWYMTRKEPKLGKNTNFSLDQGKEI